MINNEDLYEVLRKEYWINKFLDLKSNDFSDRNKNYVSAKSFLESSVCQEVGSIAKNNPIAEFAIYLMCYSIAIKRFFGNNQILIGSPDLENISLDGQEYLFYRLDYDEDSLLKEVLMTTQKELQDIMRYKNFSYEDLSHHLINKNIILSRNLDYGIFYSSVSKDESLIKRFNFQLYLSKEDEGTICLHLTFDRNIFPDVIPEVFLDGFRMLLINLRSCLNTPVKEVEIVSDEEKSRILKLGNSNNIPYFKGKTIIEIFEETVSIFPQRIALVSGSENLTYQDLNERSNQLAHYLLNNFDICPNDLIGIMVDRSEFMVIGLLGILKAGGAYVPIDSAYPRERCEYIVAHSKISVLLTDNINLRQSEKISTSVLTNVDITNLQYQNWSKENLAISSSGANLAYVIYTSGTTGSPKGVMIEHRNVISLMTSAKKLFDFSIEDVWSMFHSYNFDFSVWEMYGALLLGAKLIIVPREITINTHRFWELIKKEGITVLNQTPSSFYNLVSIASNDLKQENNIKYVIFGGEALNPGKLRAWKEKYPSVKLINMYGITETTVHTTFKEITWNEIDQGKSNIGKPIPGLSIDIIGEGNKIVPIGVPGEICINGTGLSRGYLNNSELTDAKFVSHPFRIGTRMYKSGDIGRWLPGGDIEYIGRKDFQEKIRGYRIELGEIEEALLRFPGIEQAIIVLKEQKEQDDKILIGYIVSPITVPADDLKKYLRNILPDYMVPAYLIQIQKLPLTSSGKVDRKYLLNSEAFKSIEHKSYTAPASPLEEKLTAIWQEILGIKKIGVEEDFFDAGGHSLKAIKLTVMIEERLQIKIDIMDIFNCKTIRELAKHISGKKAVAHFGLTDLADWFKERFIFQKDSDRLYTVQNKHSENKEDVFFLPPGFGLPFWSIRFVRQMDDAINAYSFDYIGFFRFEKDTDLKNLWKKFAEQIVALTSKKHVFLVGWSMGGYACYETARILESFGYSASLYIIDQIPFKVNKPHEGAVAEFKDLEDLLNNDLYGNEIINGYYEILRKGNQETSLYQTTEGSVNSDITVFMGKDTDLTTPEVWQEYSTKKIRIIEVEGDHNTVIKKFDNNTQLISEVIINDILLL